MIRHEIKITVDSGDHLAPCFLHTLRRSPDPFQTAHRIIRHHHIHNDVLFLSQNADHADFIRFIRTADTRIDGAVGDLPALRLFRADGKHAKQQQYSVKKSFHISTPSHHCESSPPQNKSVRSDVAGIWHGMDLSCQMQRLCPCSFTGYPRRTVFASFFPIKRIMFYLRQCAAARSPAASPFLKCRTARQDSTSGKPFQKIQFEITGKRNILIFIFENRVKREIRE